MINEKSPFPSKAEERVQLEIAMETLAEYAGLFNAWIIEEEDKKHPNADKISIMEQEITNVRQERKNLTPDNLRTLHKALYVYAPLFKKIRAFV